MKRLLLWIALLVALVSLAMNVAHIGSSWLWNAAIVAAVALIFVIQKPWVAGPR